MSSKAIIVAIDIGTTYSGYAFAFRRELDKGQQSVYANTMWHSGNFLSPKTPTCLLLTPMKKLHSFGYEAENKYSDLFESGKYHDWFYFKHFKMRLSADVKFQKDMIIDDENGKSFHAIDVFSISIKYLIDHFMDNLKSRGTQMTEKDVQWILTVPAIWNQEAKQFMREAAMKAGIKGKHLRLALEPEAAAMQCIDLDDYVSRPKSVIMVCDLGGGTADMTVYKIKDKHLCEIYMASGGPWGGLKVDFEFQRFLSDLLGDDVMKRFSEPSVKSDYQNFIRSFELSKRSINIPGRTTSDMVIPTSLREACLATGQELKSVICNSKYKEHIEIKRDKLKLDHSILDKLYQPTIRSILEHIEKIANQNVSGLSHILLVGGFSESILVQRAIKEKFAKSAISVEIPPESGICVLKGAVLYGFSPNRIISRVMRYTYGIRRSEIFNEDKHNPDFQFEVDGIKRCENIFQILVHKDEKLQVDAIIEKRSKTLKPEQVSIPYELFVSNLKTPVYVMDSSCRKIGNKHIAIDRPTKEIQWFRDRYVFGDTEISLQVKCEKTGKTWHFTFPLE